MMTTTDNKTERLSQDIGQLKLLDKLRDDARTLRDDGIDALINFSVKDSTWEQEISENERVLFRRAKHLAWNLGKIPVHECDHNDVLYFSGRLGRPSPGLHPSKSHDYPEWPEINVPVFRLDDFQDAASFCQQLKEAQDPLSRHLRDQFATITSEQLDQYSPGTTPANDLLKNLVKELNDRLEGSLLYEKERFEWVKLSKATKVMLARKPKDTVLMRLNRLLLCDAYPVALKRRESVEPFDMPGEPAPILFAANFLRTRLGNLRGYLDEGTLLCYYRVLRELYNLHDTNWAFGAARPGELTGKPSVFVTTECTRAIGYFARLLENTAQFLKTVHEIKKYVEHVRLGQTGSDQFIPRLPEIWCESELAWCTASIKTSIEGFRDYVALLLPNFEEDSTLEEIIVCVEKSLLYFAEHSVNSFEDVKDWTKVLRKKEHEGFQEWRRQQRRAAIKSNEARAAALQQMPELDLTETAHRVAFGALAGARQQFKRLLDRKTQKRSTAENLTPGGPKEKELLEEASEIFVQLAKWLRTHLDPAREYFEKNLHRCLAENMRGKSPRVVQELALSSLSAGLISRNWQRPDYSQALEILCENLDEKGEFPDGPPFCFTAKGEGRVVINAQIIRAFAQLAQHLTANLEPQMVERLAKVIERMIGYFRAHAIEREHGVAWPSLGSVRKRSCLWITSLSVLSLHRIVLMLNAYINEGVKKHFKRKSPAELRDEGIPFLHELMCSDIGYVSLPASKRPEERRVVMELEEMRAHLLGPGRSTQVLRAKEALGNPPLRSLILYGPPGTGKTTLAKSLALSSNVDLVEVRSHDLLRRGTELIMEQASDVMDALRLLTSTVILFDEFEIMLHPRTESPVRITEMLTGNMLPKLDELYKAAGENGIGYLLATNYVERLESAAIRDGRFDRMMYIYYPDAPSRTCRLVSEFRHLMNNLKNANASLNAVDGADLRLLEVVSKTSKCYINRLCRSGWFISPRDIKTVPILGAGENGKEPNEKLIIAHEIEDKLSPVWKYIIENDRVGVPNLARTAEKMNSLRGEPPAPSYKVTSILEPVERWDNRLQEMVENKDDLTWEKAIQLMLH